MGGQVSSFERRSLAHALMIGGLSLGRCHVFLMSTEGFVEGIHGAMMDIIIMSSDPFEVSLTILKGIVSWDFMVWCSFVCDGCPFLCGMFVSGV